MPTPRIAKLVPCWLAAALCVVGSGLLLGPRLFGFLGRLFFQHIAGAFAHGVRVKDQYHRAIAEDGGAGEDIDITQDGGQRLDDDFFRIEHVIDDEAIAAFTDLDDHDEGGVFIFRRFKLKRWPKLDQGQ